MSVKVGRVLPHNYFFRPSYFYSPVKLKYLFVPDSVAQSDACSICDQEVASSRLRSGTILSLRLIMKSFLLLFSSFR